MTEFTDEINNNLKKNIDVLKIHRRYIYVIVSVITLAVCVLLMRECQNQKHTDDLVKKISNYSDSAKYYKSKYGVVAFNQALSFDNEKQLKAYLSKNDTIRDLLKKFKKLNSVTIIKEKIVVHDTVPVYFTKDNIIPCDFKPFRIKRDTTWYHFVGTIHRDKFVIDTILIPNKQTIAVGYKKINLFKREQRVEVINSNPYLQVSNVGGYVINKDKKWYERPAVTFLIGTAVGSGATMIYGTVKK